jgi:hypothetical protein
MTMGIQVVACERHKHVEGLIGLSFIFYFDVIVFYNIPWLGCAVIVFKHSGMTSFIDNNKFNNI